MSPQPAPLPKLKLLNRNGPGAHLTAADCDVLLGIYMEWMHANYPFTEWDEVQAVQQTVNRLTRGAGRERFDVNAWNLSGETP